LGIGIAVDEIVESEHNPLSLTPGGLDPIFYLLWRGRAVNFKAVYRIRDGWKRVVTERDIDIAREVVIFGDGG